MSYTSVTKFKTKAEVDGKLEYGCYVSGLFLEGASWDEEEMMLCEQPAKVLVCALNLLQVIPVEANRLKLHGTFKTPVYVTPQRANAMQVGLVFLADLTSGIHESLWSLQGVCLTLNTDT